MKTPGGWNYRHVKDLLATTSTGFLLTGIEPAPVARVTNSSVKFKKNISKPTNQPNSAQPEDVVWSGWSRKVSRQSAFY